MLEYSYAGASVSNIDGFQRHLGEVLKPAVSAVRHVADELVQVLANFVVLPDLNGFLKIRDLGLRTRLI